MEFSDIAILLIITASSVIGLVRGLVKEFFAMIALVGGLVLAIYFSSAPAKWIPATQWNLLGSTIDSHAVSFIVSFIVIVIATMIMGRLIGVGISRVVTVGGIGNINRFLGLIFGIVRGGIIVALLVMVAGLTKFPMTDTWQRSQLLPTFEMFAYYAVTRLPANYSKHFWAYPTHH